MKRTVEQTLRDELASSTAAYGRAITRKEEAEKRVDAEKAALRAREDERQAAKGRADRAVAALEAYLGHPLDLATASAVESAIEPAKESAP